MANIHAINAQGTEYGITAENGITQAQVAKIATIGEVAELTTTAKQNVVSAVNEVNGKATDNKADIGDLSALITSAKTTLVGAINSEQEILNNILNSYGRNVTSSIGSTWLADINTKVNSSSAHTLFTLFSIEDNEGFVMGWRRDAGDLNAIFLYSEFSGICFRRSGTWTFYSVLTLPM